jgi:hypothetical protein
MHRTHQALITLALSLALISATEGAAIATRPPGPRTKPTSVRPRRHTTATPLPQIGGPS